MLYIVLFFAAIVLTIVFSYIYSSKTKEKYVNKYYNNFIDNITNNNIQYQNKDYDKRLNIYSENIEKYGIKILENPFLSWTQNEYNALFNNYKSCSQLQKQYIVKKDISDVKISSKFLDNFDWSTTNNYIGKSIVSEIFFQGFCGCSYAFASLGIIESAIYLSNNDFTKQIEPLSYQQIIDCTSGPTICDKNKPCKGCAGCSIDDIIPSYFNIITNISYNKNNVYKYSYTSTDNSSSKNLKQFNYADAEQNCIDTQKNVDTNLDSQLIDLLELLYVTDEKYLKEIIYKFGPVYVTYDGAINDSFKVYPNNLSGKSKTTINDIYIGPNKSNKNISGTHSMIVVGWGTYRTSFFSKTNYWIVKNSWGINWGLDGYLKIKSSPNNTLFKDIVALRIVRPCIPDDTSCSLYFSSNPYWYEYNGLYYVDASITFKAFRKNINYSFSLDIYIVIGNDNTKGIYPNNQQIPFNTLHLLDNNNNRIDSTSTYYFNKSPSRSNYVQTSVKNGLWFIGDNINISGVATGGLTFPLTGLPYSWTINLTVYDENGHISSEARTKIFWASTQKEKDK